MHKKFKSRHIDGFFKAVMERENKTQSLSEILNSSIFGDDAKGRIKNIVKHSTIFSFWDEIAGKKFSTLTKPYAIKYSTIYISAKSPVVIQELTLMKKKLLDKINMYSKPLGINIKDIVYNYKNFAEESNIKENIIEDKPINITKEELESILIDDNFKNKIISSVEKITFLDSNKKKLLIEKILNNKKAIICRENK